MLLWLGCGRLPTLSTIIRNRSACQTAVHYNSLTGKNPVKYSDMVKDDNIAGYPIRAVSKLTGISIDTLRAWERRYKAVVPTRNARGRLYNAAQVRRLTLLHAA